MISTSIASSIGMGYEYPVVLDDINYVTSTSDFWASGELTFDTTKLIRKEDLLKTYFKGMNGDKVLGYDIDLEKLFILPNGDLLEYNIIFIDSVTKQTYDGYSKEVPVMTALEIDLDKSSASDKRIVLKSTSTVAQTNFSYLVKDDDESLYDNVMQSSFVNDSDVDESDLTGFIFMWASTYALKKSYRYLFDGDVDFGTTDSLIGVYDNPKNFKTAYRNSGLNNRTFKDIIVAFITAEPEMKFTTDDEINVHSLLYYPNPVWFLEFSNNFKRLEPTSKATRDLARVVNSVTSMDSTFDSARSYVSRDILFCYMFAASNTIFAVHPTKGSQEELDLLTEQQQTLSLYSGINVLQSITEITSTEELVLNVADLADPFAIINIEVSITEGSLTNNYIANSNVTPMESAQSLKDKFFNKFEIEHDEYGNISTITIEPNNAEAVDGTYTEPRYMIINWLYR